MSGPESSSRKMPVCSSLKDFKNKVHSGKELCVSQKAFFGGLRIGQYWGRFVLNIHKDKWFQLRLRLGQWRLIAGTGCLRDAVVPRHPCTFLGISFGKSHLLKFQLFWGGDNTSSWHSWGHSDWFKGEHEALRANETKDTFAENSGTMIWAFPLSI